MKSLIISFFSNKIASSLYRYFLSIRYSRIEKIWIERREKKLLYYGFVVWVWVYWCFTSHATIFQSYMWRHRCAGGLMKKLYIRSGSQRHDISQCSLTCPSYTDTGPPFLYGDSDTPPHLVAFYDTLGIRRMYSQLKPPASGVDLRGYRLFHCTFGPMDKHRRNWFYATLKWQCMSLEIDPKNL